MPAPRKLHLDDYALLDMLEKGRSCAEIGRLHGVSAQAVRWRITALKKNLPAPAARRADETLAQTLSAIDELHRNHQILADLRDACLRQLEGPDGTLDVGPHDTDVQIVVSQNGGPPRRMRLTELLADQPDTLILSMESKCADPRSLLTSVLTQIRSQIELAVRLAERIHDAQQLALFQQTLLEHIETAAPDVAAAIKSALHEHRELRLSLTPPSIQGT